MNTQSISEKQESKDSCGMAWKMETNIREHLASFSVVRTGNVKSLNYDEPLNCAHVTTLIWPHYFSFASTMELKYMYTVRHKNTPKFLVITSAILD